MWDERDRVLMIAIALAMRRLCVQAGVGMEADRLKRAIDQFTLTKQLRDEIGLDEEE
jgi:hypothetical protein